ncbi:MAG TPA: serine hydrolase domain-containing protein [Solirubrobacteraceae bacterium]|nr:serine hydrolase domain-containing protein [Solirubrobacteraceae bacterium]
MASAFGPSGTAIEAFAPVTDAFARLLGDGAGGGSITVRLRGETVLALSTGWADRARTRPWTPETLGVSFSTTKGAASTVIHRLVERGLLGYDDPVCAHWPEFAAGGKGTVTVREVLTHRAGLSSVQAVARDAEEMLDHELMEERLAARSVRAPTARSAYHAITYGWLLSGLARRVTGRGMRELVRSELADTLATDGLNIGAPSGAEGRIAQPVGSALRQIGSVARLASPLLSATRRVRIGYEALLIPGFHRLFHGSEPPIWHAEMPAVNGLFTADGLAQLYGALANGGAEPGGPRLLTARTVREIGRVQLRTRDRVLGLPMRWRLGYHQAFGSGDIAPRAFGHYGYGGSGGWADPAIGLSLGFVTNRIGSLTTPMGDLTLYRLNRVVRECAAAYLGR